MFLIRTTRRKLGNKLKSVLFLASSFDKKLPKNIVTLPSVILSSGTFNQDRNSLQIQNNAYSYTGKKSSQQSKTAQENSSISQIDSKCPNGTLNYSQTEIQRKIQLSPKHQKQWEFFFTLSQQQKVSLLQNLRQKENFQQLADLAKEMAFQKQTCIENWKIVEEVFLYLLVSSQDQDKIRIIGRLLYALERSRKYSKNYQKPISKIIPYCSSRSFAHIFNTMAKMGKLSKQFSVIISEEYKKRKYDFSPRQLTLLNYNFAKQNMAVDPQLSKEISKFPLSSIALMLKTFDHAKIMSEQVLQKCIPFILMRRKETKLQDLGRLINIYTKYRYLEDQRILSYLISSYQAEAYKINNEKTFLEIWQYMPQNINLNKVPIEWLESLRKTIIRLNKLQAFSIRGQNILGSSIEKINNQAVKSMFLKN